MLAGALTLGGAPALADPGLAPGDLQEAAGPTDPSTPVTPGPGAPVDGAVADLPDGAGAAQPAPAPTAAGLLPNGGSGGPAVFSPVPTDPEVVPGPPVNEALPVEVDERGAFAQQVSCDPVDRPGVTAFALLVTGHYDRPTYSGARPCIDYASFHHDGRGLDWPLDAFDAADRQIADAALVWLTENDGEMADRFGLEYLIWNGLIWHGDGRGWRFYTGTPHTDHIHFSFTWDGAQMRTSWWTGVAVTQPDLGPCDAVPGQYAGVHQVPRLAACEAGAIVTAPVTGMARVRPGESGGGVAVLQDQLGLTVSGVLDEATREALMDWQDEHDLPVTGVADDLTYAASRGWEIGRLPTTVRPVRADWQTTAFTPHLRTTLAEGDTGEAVAVLQDFLGVEADGSFGPVTAQALGEWEATVPVLAAQAERRAEDSAVVTPLTWLVAERTAHPTMAVRDATIEQADLDRAADPDGELAEGEHAGGAVALLQRMLDLEDDGSFGPVTTEAVVRVQQEAGLEASGVVDGPTWVAVEEAALAAGTVEGAPGAEAARDRGTAPAAATAKDKAEQKAAEEKAAENKAQAQRSAQDEAFVATAD